MQEELYKHGLTFKHQFFEFPDWMHALQIKFDQKKTDLKKIRWSN